MMMMMMTKFCSFLLLSITAFTFPISGGDTNNDDWTLDYEVYVEGPRTIYEGTVWLHRYRPASAPYCFDFYFDIPEGRLAGPKVSSKANEPHLPFVDWWVINYSGMLEGQWCCSDLTGYEVVPTSVPRHFEFYVIKTQFTADDLGELLNDWGKEDSPWDLDADGIVGGSDLSHVLGGWKTD